MNVGNIVRLVTGAAKNAVTWGVAWTTLAFGTIIGLRTAGVVVPPEMGVLDALGMAMRIGIFGGMAGSAFALVMSLLYRGRRLSEISWVRFGLGGAAVAVLLMLALFTVGNLVTGDPIPALDDVLGDFILAAVFGGIAAGGSMWLAQQAERLPLGSGGARGRLGSGDHLDVGMRDTWQREPHPANRRG